MGKADPPPAELIAPPLLATAELGAAWSAAAAGLGWALRGAGAGAAPASIGLEPASGGAAASGSAGVGAAAYFLRRCAVRALSPRAHSSARPFCPPELLCKVSRSMGACASATSGQRRRPTALLRQGAIVLVVVNSGWEECERWLAIGSKNVGSQLRSRRSAMFSEPGFWPPLRLMLGANWVCLEAGPPESRFTRT